MSQFIVLVDVVGGQLETKKGDWLDYSGFTMIDIIEAHNVSEAIHIGRSKLNDQGFDYDYQPDVVAYKLA